MTRLVGLEAVPSELIASVFAAEGISLADYARAGGLDPMKDFQGADLRGWALYDIDVRGMNFSNADLRSTGIERAIRDETTIMDGARLDGDDSERHGIAIEDLPTSEAIFAIARSSPLAPFVVAQIIQSLDGRVATTSGEYRWISDDAALNHLHALRATVDAVVVGVGMILTDDPHFNVWRVRGRAPVRVVIDPTGRLPSNPACFRGFNKSECYIVCAQSIQERSDAQTILIPRKGEIIPPEDIIEALFARGLKRVLVEGGAWTVSSFIDAGVVNRLHVVVAPAIIGSGKMGLNLPPISKLADARRPSTKAYVLTDGNVIFDCDLQRADLQRAEVE